MRDFLKTDDVRNSMEKLSIPVLYQLFKTYRTCSGTPALFRTTTSEQQTSKTFGTSSPR